MNDNHESYIMDMHTVLKTTTKTSTEPPSMHSIRKKNDLMNCIKTMTIS